MAKSRNVFLAVVTVAFLALHNLAAQAPHGQNDECNLEFLELRVLLAQIPAITIPGLSPGDIMAVSVPGIPVAISGEAKVLIQHQTGCGGDDTADLPSEVQVWKLDVPPGSQSVLSTSDVDVSAKFTPDVPGPYTVHFTVCAASPGTHNSDCTMMAWRGFTATGKPIYKSITLPQTERTLTIQVTNGVQIPPILRPVDHPIANGLQPTTPQHYSLARDFCGSQFGIAFGAPEWYTTNIWTGPTPPYEPAEGRIYKSIMAGADVPLNHQSNDVNAYFDLDPPFLHLLIDDNAEDKGNLLPLGGIELEWEFMEYPEEFRPVVGDRMSALGFHVVDCGHEIFTEIHPPIAVAVHRPSAVNLPATVAFDLDNASLRPVGANIFVPGILTDVFVSLRGGETLGDVERGLHQPRTVLVQGPHGNQIPVAVKVNQPTTAGVTFTFRVFLPPSPFFVLQQYGITPTFKPALYWREVAHPAAQKYGSREGLGLQLVEQQLDGSTPYLRFSMDLSPLATGDRVARRIEAAWVYPDLSGANWGLQNISIHLDKFKVTDTGDFTTGDWKLWANITGSTIPWIKLIDCHGCVEEKTYTPLSSIWERGAIAPDGTLGTGAVMRFQPGQLQFTGYDDDVLNSDGIAPLSVYFFGSMSGSASVSNSPNPSYMVTYSFSSFPNPGSVSQEATDYFRHLLVHPAVPTLVRREVESELFNLVLHSSERDKIVSRYQEEADSPAFNALRPANLAVTLQSNNAEVFAQQLRKRILSQYGGIPKEADRAKLAWRLQQIKPSIPVAIYQKYLCDLETGKPCPPQP